MDGTNTGDAGRKRSWAWFDVLEVPALGHEQRAKNVLAQAGAFKLRIIELAAGEAIPECEMSSHVIFVGLAGDAQIAVGSETTTVSHGQCLVTGPARLAMTTTSGARLLGIQIESSGTADEPREGTPRL